MIVSVHTQSKKILGYFTLVLVLALAGIHNSAAAETTTRGTITTSTLRVCADPNNLPFSNTELEGFENKIVEIIASELEKPVHYTWFPQTVGYVRNTLQLNECDLITGITIGNERVQNTNPYYRSVYALVYAQKNGPLPLDFSDQIYQSKAIGIVAGTPAANLVAQYGLLKQVMPYQLTVDTRYFSTGKQIMDDIENGVIDAAIIWGPIAGYYANLSKQKITVVPLTDETKSLKLDYSITMAVRYNDQDWKLKINDVLKSRQPDILSVLKQYKVPLLDNVGQLIVD